jgi:hypothetical protein
MVRSSRKGLVLDRDTPVGQSSRRRRRTKLSVECEALDSRQLLSIVAVTPALLSVPAATTVATAETTLNGSDPTAFAQFQTALARAESQSHVTLTQVRKLARSEKIIDQTIESYSLDANTEAALLNQVQTDVDDAFLESSLPAPAWAQKQQELSQMLGQALPSVHISSFVIRATIDQMKAVARAAGSTSQFSDIGGGDWTALLNDLESTPDTSVGSVSANLDPVEVYYEAHVNDFIK